MTTTHFLLRHAAHDNVGAYLAGRLPGVTLGPEGRAQAERLAVRMAHESFAAIYASPRERTVETAAIVAARSNVPLVVCDDLDEVDFGCWSGRDFEDLQQDPRWRHWNAAREVAVTPNGESMQDVQDRALLRLQAIGREHPQGAVAIVSHADVIKSIVCHVLGLPLSAAHRFDIEPASVSVIVMGAWGARLLRLNDME